MKHAEETKKAISEKMQGNKNAEVWNAVSVTQMLSDIKTYLTNNISVYTIGSALTEFDLYTQWWSEMKDKFVNDKSVSDTIKNIESIIEQRIVNDTMTGDAKSATFSIFLLKNKFGYVDKQEQDLTTKGESLNIISLGSGIKPKTE